MIFCCLPVCIKVSTPFKNNNPLFFAKPPFNLQTVQAPLLFQAIPPIDWIFVNAPLKIEFFSELL